MFSSLKNKIFRFDANNSRTTGRGYHQQDFVGGAEQDYRP
jgi:hypothetical protein